MFDVSSLTSGLKNATVQTIQANSKQLKSKKVVLKFQHLGSDSALKVIVYSDATFGDLSDGGTQGGHLILLMGEDGKFSPLS